MSEVLALPKHADQLVWQAVYALSRKFVRKSKRRRGFFWGDVADLFCVGSTYATQIARTCGFDPDTGEEIAKKEPR